MITASLPEPSVGGVYGHAWNQLRKFFVPLLLIGIVSFAAQAIGSSLISAVAPTSPEAPNPLNSALSTIFNLAVVAPLNYGAFYANLRAARDNAPTFDDLFIAFRSYYLQSVIASVVMGIAVGIGFVLLIVPGIFLLVKLSFTPFLVVDEGMNAMDALKENWNRTSGYGMTIFGAALVAIPIIIVGFLALIIGVIPASMLVSLAYASLFAAVTARRATSAGREMQ